MYGKPDNSGQMSGFVRFSIQCLLIYRVFCRNTVAAILVAINLHPPGLVIQNALLESFVHSLIHSFIHPSIHSFIHSFIFYVTIVYMQDQDSFPRYEIQRAGQKRKQSWTRSSLTEETSRSVSCIFTINKNFPFSVRRLFS